MLEIEEIFDYVKERGLSIFIHYINDEDVIKIQVSKKDGVSTYTVESFLDGCIWSEELLLARVKTMAQKVI